jgi:general secretion pathway protein F/type IV pilus assembly protein PilC
MLFKYKGYDESGKRVKGTLSATSEQEAASVLRHRKIHYETLRPATPLFSMKDIGKRSIPPTLLSSFSKELASYLRSGMTVLTAIRLLENQYRDKHRYSLFLQSVRNRIEEGNSLYQALYAQEIYTLPRFFLKSLDIAAQGGKLTEALQSMGEYFSTQNRIHKQVKNAMIYPAVIFTVAIGMTGFLISYVVPKIVKIFQDTGQELPPLTQFVLGVNHLLTRHYIEILAVFILLVLTWKLLYRFSPRFKRGVDAMWLRMPFFGTLIQNHELGRFSYILSLLLRSGVAYAQAVRLAVSSFHNSALKERFDTASKKVAEGNKLSRALQLTPGPSLKRNFLQALALGEESSEVAEVLENIAALYGEENDDKIKVALSLLEPMMMLLVGLIVGVIVASMLLPIFTMTKGLQ